ncbi:flagellin [Brumicola nitratireducens]|uniref:Flagellin n=1 Tax=Glaciecola nitratireducens (strain JCM 12485 / KCTC 12276 / FR1064) TaxID=1085623 RepID=G4QHW6_GLANF|nr:flagellin [Glaciecola nitratireducens]AEP30499.1 flagellin-like protein [Glaciecola nitratireducens FR1064]
MSLFVSTNVSALQAQRQIFTSSTRLDTAYERLSSGFRINSSKDDAAGQQISDLISTQVNGLNQAVRNANDGISLAQTAEGAMQEITNALQRIRVLAIQSQNGINSANDRNALQKEVSALKSEIDRVSSTTQFAGVDILSGNFSSIFLVGANSGQFIAINLSRQGGFSTKGLFGNDEISVANAGLASAAVSFMDTAISMIDSKRAELGALQNRFQSSVRNLAEVAENASQARSRIKDTDFAEETAVLTRLQISQEASVTVLGQANQRAQQALQLLQ